MALRLLSLFLALFYPECQDFCPYLGKPKQKSTAAIAPSSGAFEVHPGLTSKKKLRKCRGFAGKDKTSCKRNGKEFQWKTHAKQGFGRISFGSLRSICGRVAAKEFLVSVGFLLLHRLW